MSPFGRSCPGCNFAFMVIFGLVFISLVDEEPWAGREWGIWHTVNI